MQADCGKHALVFPPRRGPHPIDAARGTHGQVMLVHAYLPVFQLPLYYCMHTRRVCIMEGVLFLEVSLLYVVFLG